MEQKAPNGYDYGRVREKMLRSWGKKTGTAPEKEEKAEKAGYSEKKIFKVKQKSAKIKTGNVKNVKKNHVAVQKKRQESRIEKEVPAAVLPYEQQIKQVDTKKEEHSATIETMTGNEGLSGPVLDPRQWVMYDAVFGPPRCRRPWKPCR